MISYLLLINVETTRANKLIAYVCFALLAKVAQFLIFGDKNKKFIR